MVIAKAVALTLPEGRATKPIEREQSANWWTIDQARHALKEKMAVLRVLRVTLPQWMQ